MIFYFTRQSTLGTVERYTKGLNQNTQGTEPVWRVFADNTRGGAARKFAEWPKGSKVARRMIARVKTIAFIMTMQGGGEST